MLMISFIHPLVETRSFFGPYRVESEIQQACYRPSTAVLPSASSVYNLQLNDILPKSGFAYVTILHRNFQDFLLAFWSDLSSSLTAPCRNWTLCSRQTKSYEHIFLLLHFKLELVPSPAHSHLHPLINPYHIPWLIQFAFQIYLIHAAFLPLSAINELFLLYMLHWCHPYLFPLSRALSLPSPLLLIFYLGVNLNPFTWEAYMCFPITVITVQSLVESDP